MMMIIGGGGGGGGMAESNDQFISACSFSNPLSNSRSLNWSHRDILT
jgi:hypothetical protein